MLGWLKRLVSSGPTASPRRPGRSVDDLVVAVKDALASDAIVAGAGRRELCVALDELSARGALEDHLPELRSAFADFYQRHPFEMQWGRGYEMRVVDPLGLDGDAITRGDDVPELVPWARLLRTMALDTGDRLFHHGCGLGDVLELLEAPNAPEAILHLSLPSMEIETLALRDRFVDSLCENPRLRSLEHLAFRSSMMFEPRHIEQLVSAPWASSLRSLEITEQMVDWSVDLEPAQRHPALRNLGKLRSLTHLSMYNNLGDASDVEAMLTEPFPALAHLNLGSSLKDAAGLDLILERLPTLRELSLSAGPPRTDAVWDRIVASGIPTYLSNTRVTSDYPKRT